MQTLRRSLLLLSLFAIAACSRGMEIGSPQPSATYSISVQNMTGVTMVVSYDDGRGNAILGSVGADRTERFIIAAPATQTVTVRAEAASGGRTAGPYTVTLVAGSTQSVRLR